MERGLSNRRIYMLSGPYLDIAYEIRPPYPKYYRIRLY